MFSKKRAIGILLSSVLAASMLLTACTTTPTAAGNYPGSPEAGTAIINIQTEPPDMCSITSTDATASEVLIHLLDGLTILDQNDKAIGGVAKDWKMSDDGLVYTFNLRDDYKWSNGDPVTAKDFEFSFRALIDPAFASEYAYLGYMFKNAEEFSKGECKVEDVGIKAIDDKTFELTLKYPVSYLPEMLAYKSFYPVNQKFYEATPGYGTDFNKMLFNGPFIMTKWQHSSQIVLEKNADFHGAKDIKTSKIVMEMINDANTALNAFKSNELDVVGLNSEQYAQMTAENQPTYNFNDGAVSYLEFNLNDPALKNKKIRQALCLAMDSENFVTNVIANKSIPAASFTSPGILGNKKDFVEEIGPQFKIHDIETAKKLLEEGMKEEGLDKVELSFMTEDSDVAAKYSAFIQEALQKDLGITVKIEQMPFKVKLERLENQDFQVSMSLWGPDYNDPMTYLDMFETGGGNNHGSWSNARYDELLALARTEIDRTKRFEYLAECEKILADEAPIAPYFFRFRDYTTSSKITGVVRTTFQSQNLRWAETK